MPETYWKKKRPGIAGITGRTTRVPPKEYWPGVGENELGFDGNHSSSSHKTNTTNKHNKRKRKPCPMDFDGGSPDRTFTRCKTENSSNSSSSSSSNSNANGGSYPRGGNGRSANLERKKREPPKTPKGSRISDCAREDRQDDESQEIRPPQVLLPHMRRRIPKQSTKLAPRNNNDNNNDGNEGGTRGKNRPTKIKQEEEESHQHHQQDEEQPNPQRCQQQHEELPSPESQSPSQPRQTKRPKRMLSALFPYNSVGLKAPDVEMDTKRESRKRTPLEAETPRNGVRKPAQPKPRRSRMLAAIAPFNAIGTKESENVTIVGKRRRTGVDKQPHPPPPSKSAEAQEEKQQPQRRERERRRSSKSGRSGTKQKRKRPKIPSSDQEEEEEVYDPSEALLARVLKRNSEQERRKTKKRKRKQPNILSSHAEEEYTF